MCMIGNFLKGVYQYKKPVYAWKAFGRRGFVSARHGAAWVSTILYEAADLKPGVRHTARLDGYNIASPSTTSLSLRTLEGSGYSGFWSFKTRQDAVRHYSPLDHDVIRVKLTGKILVYEQGYRSDHFEVVRKRS